MKIDVKFYPTDYDITVQSGQIDEDGTLWVQWCNHAGAEEEESYDGYYDAGREQLVEWNAKMLVCDKCDDVTEIYDEDDEDYCE